MNLLLLFAEDRVAESLFRVGGPRANHLIHGLAVKPGSTVHVGLLEGPLGKGVVVSVSGVTVEIEVVFETQAPPKPKTSLLLAVPRPKVLKRLLPQLAAIGLDELVLFRSWRVERLSLESDLLRPETYRPLLFEGLMQACTTHMPKVRIEPRFRPFVEDQLPYECPDALSVVAHPRADRSIANLASEADLRSRRRVAIGPERGLLDEEVQAFVRSNFVPARLCTPILKVETACIAALAQLEVLAQLGLD